MNEAFPAKQQAKEAAEILAEENKVKPYYQQVLERTGELPGQKVNYSPVLLFV